ncbi:uncharacterized protein LOC128727260 [Anopheles nili]|uniref:uncharacterized protein LOC128727260 n=1 Tax=Anopheles nili TaxID=185578 RepID=UPI00237C30AF|nr:uncharacterized protein LOC128727260 [Anopheles nili]
MSMQALNGQPPQRRSSLLQRYQPKGGSQDPLHQPTTDTPPTIVKSTSQRSLQNSSLLQRYQPKPLGSSGAVGAGAPQVRPQSAVFYEPPKKSSSQRSLDQSKLLRRYYHQPNSLEDAQLEAEFASQTQVNSGLQGGEPSQHRYSSQKSLEGSKLLQRYNPVNNSQEFTGLSGRESTPVARFSRGGSLEPERVQRSSLLAKYTPRFGKSLDRHQTLEAARGYGGYSSQQNLQSHPGPTGSVATPAMSQSLAASQSEFADYGTDHFDQYQNIRSRSSSLSRGGPRRAGLRGSQRMLSTESEPDPITPDMLPVVAAVPEPVVGNIASALPMPMLGSVIPPTPAVVDTGKQPSFAGPSAQLVRKLEPEHALPTAPGSMTESTTPTPPVKPIRKDLQQQQQQLAGAAAVLPPANIVSIAIPSITTTLAAPSVQKSVSPPKEPSPPLFSTRDRMDHYGSASNPDPPTPDHGRFTTKTTARAVPSTTTLQLPGISDMSSRRSMTDLRRMDGRGSGSNLSGDLEMSEFADRSEMRRVAAQRQHAVKHTLASAFEHLAALTIPQAMKTEAELEEDERIEAMPPDRKLKKRDFTYHPSFVPKQSAATGGAALSVPSLDSRRSTGSASSKASKQLEAEEKRQKAAEEKRKREEERRQREEEKRHKEAEKRAHDEAEKRRREDERHAREEDDRRRKEDDRRHKEEERRAREEEKRHLEEEKRKEKEEKKRLRDEKKKMAAALKAQAAGVASGSPSAEEPPAPEEETIDLASHLDHYSVAASQQMAPQQRSLSLGRPRSGGTPYGSQGALGRGLSNSFQNLERNGSTSSVQRQSKLLLQRYGPKSGSQEVIGSGGPDAARELHRSQGSLDYRRPMRPSLLDKYTPRPLSASTAPSIADPVTRTRSFSQRSLEAGGRMEGSSLLQRYKPKADAARTPVAGYDRYDHRDHEYEPIGDPTDASTKAPTKDGLLAVSQQQQDGQERKLSNASFLRVPAGDEGDTISMEELQKSIEDRYFNLPADTASGAQEGATDAAATAAASTASEPQGEKTNKMKAAMAKAQNSGKQAMAKAQESGKQAMARAQEGGKTLQKKLLQQTDRFKTKMSNIKLKKEAAPLASPEVVTTPELEKFDFTLAVPKDDEEPVEAEQQQVAEVAPGEEATTSGKSKFGKLKSMHMPKLQKPDFKRPEFTKIAKPKMPKLKAPDMSKFKRPEMPKFLTEKPDFSKMKPDFGKIKLARSKSMKEASPSGATSAASPSDVSTMGDVTATSAKVNYTDFSTYPRIFDKFKRQKSSGTGVSGQASVRAGTPPPLEFTKTAQTTRPNLVSRWTSDKSEDTESNRFMQYTGSELDERETSVERRMRQELERAEFEGPELAVTAEQKQLEEYDKENRAIHQLSAARHDDFLKRKPPMERQESDLASEEEKQFWASSLGQKIRQNIDMNSNDLDFLDEEERLLVAKEDDAGDQEAREQARFLLELSKQRSEKEFERRSSTPYTNQECQSSGSSSARRRKGVLEEIDDDEFFLRQKGISKDNIQMGEYISSAIKEGLSQPKNALADMDRYDYYDDELDRDRTGLHKYYQPSFESDEVSNQQSSFTDEYRGKSSDFYRTFPPDRPNRKSKKPDDQIAPQDDEDFGPEDEDDLAFYDRQRVKYGSEQPQLLTSAAARYMDDEDEDSLRRNAGLLTGSAVPPTPPTRRRKKHFRDVTPSDLGTQSSFANGFAAGKSISNSFISGPPPTSTTLAYRAEVPLAREESFGTIPEPTPRRSRSRSQISKVLDDDDRVSRGAESLIGGIIDRGSYPYEISESNGYATVRKEAPPRPPAPIRRRKSTRSLDAPPPRQFSTMPNYHHSVSPVRPTRNYSTINPNRPPRRKSVTSLTGDQQLKSSSLSKDDVAQYEDVITPAPPLGPKPPLNSGSVASKMKDRPLPPPPRPTRKPRRPDGSDHHDLDGGGERITLIEETEMATQTDPVSEDFGLDAEIAAVTERAARANDSEQLEGALNRFREGNAKALSERPKSSRSGSRPETPASILIERKVSTPSLAHESVVEASLTVQPLEEFDDDQYIAELVKKYVSEERKPEPTRKADAFERRLRKSTNSLTREDEIRPVEVSGSTSLRTPTLRSSRTSAAATPEPLRSVEIAPDVIEEIVERLRTTEQQHIDELHKLHQQQLEDLRRQHDEQKRLQEQKLEEQQRQLLVQQSQQLLETQQLKEQIQAQQEHQKVLLTQQQNQQQQLLVAQQQQQLLMEQQEKERELQREKERELLKERELELERARERERELHLARELELQRAREIEQQRSRDLEQQRLREMEMQRARELEHQRLRELEIQRAIEAEQARQREIEMQQHQRAAAAAAAAAAAVTVTPMTAVTASNEPKEPAMSLADGSQQDTTVASELVLENGASAIDVVDGAAAALPATTAASSEQLPARPPLPPFAYHPDYLPFHGVPPSAAAAAAAASYLMRSNPSEEDLGGTPLAPHRRRRHHRSKRESTSEEDFQREQRRHRHGTRSPEPPSIPSLGGQLVRACGSSLRQTGDDLMAMLRASSKDENKRDLHIAIIILIVIVAGLMALGMSGEKAVHHHHWDYFSPPGHGSSA